MHLLEKIKIKHRAGVGRWIADRGSFLFFLIAFFFIAFVGGAIVTVAGIGPSGYFKDAYRAGTALYDKMARYHDPLSTDLWAPVRTPEMGVARYDRSRANDGMTLFTSGHANKAFLIDMQGRSYLNGIGPTARSGTPLRRCRTHPPIAEPIFTKPIFFPTATCWPFILAWGIPLMVTAWSKWIIDPS